MKICNSCILTENFPGISFDDKGVCNFCRSYKPENVSLEAKKQYEDRFVALTAEHCNPSGYDVLMAYSGGKDSTYTLDLFVNYFRLKVLALTFDNTFISERSFVNMNNVTESLGVDHLIIRPNPVTLRKIFMVAAEKELYSPKAMERASTICTSCIGLVKAVTLRTALEKRIPFVGFGWSPGQAPLQASVMRTNPSMVRMTQKAIQEPLCSVAGQNALSQYFVDEEQFADPQRFPWNIHPLAFLEYDEDKIVARNRELGWEKPQDTDANSTNCMLNAYANQVHMNRYGFHPYAWEIANMVRSGVMAREKGLEKFVCGENPDLVKYAKEILEGR
ncbi:putative protein [Geobacter sp. OR-1]|uniref:hypothetical protein n=1 Tax=Geobacter sp. OR-1 TaxID=1266765 RepID=UPI000543D0C6|nr:hypothetical protein [Geobacter sp. OR-1]GAM10590.1 putative protein [Geobacter sp. OR-1]